MRNDFINPELWMRAYMELAHRDPFGWMKWRDIQYAKNRAGHCPSAEQCRMLMLLAHGQRSWVSPVMTINRMEEQIIK